MSGSVNIPVVSKFDATGIKQAEGALKGFGSSLAKIGAAIGVAFAARAVSNFAKEAVLAAEGVATANARIGQIAKTTGLFGDETQAVTDRLIGFAKAQEMRLAVDAEVIKSVQGQLLTFKALGASADEAGGIFDRTTEAAFNMAAAGFGSAESNAIQLGKALEDPIRGLTALRRSGTTFTAEQQDLIKTMVESGDLFGAQTLILGELDAQYGGVAEATANASDKMALAFKNIKKTAGAALLPVFNELVEALIPVTEAIGEELGEAVRQLSPLLLTVARALPGLLTAFTPLIPIIVKVAGVFFELIEKLLPVFVSLMEMLMPVFDALMPILDIVVGLFDLFLIPVGMLIGLLTPLLETILPPLTFAFGLLADALGFMDEVFSPIVESLMPAFNHIVESVAGPIIDHFKSQLEELTDDGFQYLIDAGILPAGTSMQDLSNIAAKQSYRFANLWVKAFNDVITGINGVTRAFITWNNTNLKGLQGFGLFTNLKPLQFEPIPLIPMLSETAFSPSADAIEYGGFGPGVAAPYNAFRMTPMAEGGIVTGPLNALIGEAGPEAVIPLDRMGKMGGNTYNVTINANVADARLGEVVVNAIKRYERTSGPVFASA